MSIRLLKKPVLIKVQFLLKTSTKADTRIQKFNPLKEIRLLVMECVYIHPFPFWMNLISLINFSFESSEIEILVSALEVSRVDVFQNTTRHEHELFLTRHDTRHELYLFFWHETTRHEDIFFQHYTKHDTNTKTWKIANKLKIEFKNYLKWIDDINYTN
jgi:hypothetical protein